MKYAIFFLSVFLFLGTSCLDKVEEKPGTLGKLATNAKVSDAIDKATEGISAFFAKEGNEVYYEYNVRVDLNSVYRLGTVDRKFGAQ